MVYHQLRTGWFVRWKPYFPFLYLTQCCSETYFPRWHRCFGGIWFKFPQVPTQPWGEPASGRRGKVEHYFSFSDHQFTVCCIKHSHIMNYDGKLQVDFYLIIFHPSMDSLASLIEEADIFASSRFLTKLFWTVIDFIYNGYNQTTLCCHCSHWFNLIFSQLWSPWVWGGEQHGRWRMILRRIMFVQPCI